MKGGEVVLPGTPGAERAVYFEHSYSDALLIFLLKAARPAEFRDNYRVTQVEEPADPFSAADRAALRAMTDAELDAALAESEAAVEKRKSLLPG